MSRQSLLRNNSETIFSKRLKVERAEEAETHLGHQQNSLSMPNQIPNNFSTLYTTALALHFHQQNQQPQPASQEISSYLSKLPISLLQSQTGNGIYPSMSDELKPNSKFRTQSLNSFQGKNDEIKREMSGESEDEEEPIDDEDDSKSTSESSSSCNRSLSSSSSSSSSTASIHSKSAVHTTPENNISENNKKTGLDIKYENDSEENQTSFKETIQ